MVPRDVPPQLEP
jgi:hypothetical protein